MIGESSILASIGSRIPWLNRATPKMFGNAVIAGTDQSITDYLKTGIFSLKRAIVPAAFGFFLSFGAWYISSHLDGIITKINGLSLSTALKYLLMELLPHQRQSVIPHLVSGYRSLPANQMVKSTPVLALKRNLC